MSGRHVCVIGLSSQETQPPLQTKAWLRGAAVVWAGGAVTISHHGCCFSSQGSGLWLCRSMTSRTLAGRSPVPPPQGPRCPGRRRLPGPQHRPLRCFFSSPLAQPPWPRRPLWTWAAFVPHRSPAVTRQRASQRGPLELNPWSPAISLLCGPPTHLAPSRPPHVGHQLSTGTAATGGRFRASCSCQAEV